MERHFRQDSISMKRLMPYFFIGPALLALVALVVYPLLYGVYISFFKTNLANKWDFVGLKNYISVFSDGVFVKQLGVTLKFTAIVVLAHFIIGIFLAMLLNQSRPGITFFRTILVLPWLMPEVVIALIFKWIMNPLYGLLNYGMQLLGLSEGGVSWLGDTKYAFISVVLVCIWKGYPLVMVNALAALQSVSTDIYEAAKVDGANNIQTFFRIILPSIKPVLATTLILDTVWWFKHYTIVYLMTKGGPGSDTSIVSIEIYKQAFEIVKWNRHVSDTGILRGHCADTYPVDGVNFH